MKIIATLLVRDEIEIVEANIRHHLERGVDGFVVTDNGSTDGTRELLPTLPGVLDVFDQSGHTMEQSKWVTEMAKYVCNKYQPDWVLHLDADEFWGHLSYLETVPPNVCTVFLDPTRTWVHKPVWGEPDKPGPFDPRNFPFCVRQETQIRLIHRPSMFVRVDQGLHAVHGLIGDVVTSSALEMHHYMLRHYAQFERKVKNGGSAISQYPGGGAVVSIGVTGTSSTLRTIFGRITTGSYSSQGNPFSTMSPVCPDNRSRGRLVDCDADEYPLLCSLPAENVMSTPEACWLAREITTHRVGRGDNENVTVEALQPGTYRVSVPRLSTDDKPTVPDAPPKPCARPSHLGSESVHHTVLEFKSDGTSGLTDEALLAVLLDRLRSREQTDARAKQAAFHLEDALNALRAGGR